MSSWGLKNRLARIIQPATGRTVMLASTTVLLGPTTGLEDPGATIAPLLPYADTLMLTRGCSAAAWTQGGRGRADRAARLGGTSILSELSNEGIVMAMEDAVRLNAAGVALSVYVGAQYERQTLLALASLVDEGERLGIPSSP